MNDTINSASESTDSAPMTGVGQVSSVSMDIEGGDAPINTVSEADVGQVPSPTQSDGMAAVMSVSVDEGSDALVKSAV